MEETLGQRASEYAKYIMSVVAYALDKEAITDLLADAYEQGWIDCDTDDIEPGE